MIVSLSYLKKLSNGKKKCHLFKDGIIINLEIINISALHGTHVFSLLPQRHLRLFVV